MLEWPELLSEMAELEPAPDVTRYVLSRASAELRPAGGRLRLRGGGRASAWLLAGLGGAVVVLALALAAHTRDRDAPATGGWRTWARNEAAIIIERLDASGTLTKTAFSGPPGNTAASGNWLYLWVPSTTGPDGTKAAWQAAMLAGALNAAAASSRHAPLDGYVVLSGSARPECRPADALSERCRAVPSSTRSAPPYDATRWGTSEEEMRAQITSGLVQAGLRPVSIRFVNTLGPDIPVVVAEGNSATVDRRPDVSVFGDNHGYEGYFLEVIDAHELPVLAIGLASRLSTGAGWNISGPKLDASSMPWSGPGLGELPDPGVDADPFGPNIGARIDPLSPTAMPGGLPLPSTALLGRDQITSAWRHGRGHLVLEYSGLRIRVIVTPSQVTDPARTYSGIANQDGEPNDYRYLFGRPALVVERTALRPSGVELVIGDVELIIQGDQESKALVAIARSMIID
jgi:hypothetical protein